MIKNRGLKHVARGLILPASFVFVVRVNIRVLQTVLHIMFRAHLIYNCGPQKWFLFMLTAISFFFKMRPALLPYQFEYETPDWHWIFMGLFWRHKLIFFSVNFLGKSHFLFLQRVVVNKNKDFFRKCRGKIRKQFSRKSWNYFFSE